MVAVDKYEREQLEEECFIAAAKREYWAERLEALTAQLSDIYMSEGCENEDAWASIRKKTDKGEIHPKFTREGVIVTNEEEFHRFCVTNNLMQVKWEYVDNVLDKFDTETGEPRYKGKKVPGAMCLTVQPNGIYVKPSRTLVKSMGE